MMNDLKALATEAVRLAECLPDRTVAAVWIMMRARQLLAEIELYEEKHSNDR